MKKQNNSFAEFNVMHETQCNKSAFKMLDYACNTKWL